MEAPFRRAFDAALNPLAARNALGIEEGGGGGGTGHDAQGQEGEAGGFGAQARPAGVYVVRDGNVRWQPAVDVNRIFMVVGAVVITWLLTRRRTRGS